jgi:Flp pilus assembly protein TadG
LAEFGLVAPIFILFVFGLIEIGRGLTVVHILTNAARQGCRVAVIEGKTNSDITTTIGNLLSPTGITGQTVAIQVNGTTGNVQSAVAGDEINVKVSVSVNSVSWGPGKFLSGNLVGQYSLRRE